MNNVILKGTIGSEAHGLNISDVSDHDEMGIFIESKENVMGLFPLDHLIKRDKPEGVRSEPGDTDLTLYSLRKFCRLASAGNPSVLVLLWLSEYIIKHPIAVNLILSRHQFISKQAGEKFLGYLTSQKQKLNGERSKQVTRPELVEQYGYDTKFAMHAARLGLEGIELLTTGNLQIPKVNPDKAILLDIRSGKFNFKEVLQLIEALEAQLKVEVNKCTLQANLPAINKLMVQMHEEYWNAKGVIRRDGY